MRRAVASRGVAMRRWTVVRPVLAVLLGLLPLLGGPPDDEPLDGPVGAPVRRPVAQPITLSVVPDLIGLRPAEAVARLRTLHLGLIVDAPGRDGSSDGVVSAQVPRAGRRVPPGTVVQVNLRTGPPAPSDPRPGLWMVGAGATGAGLLGTAGVVLALTGAGVRRRPRTAHVPVPRMAPRPSADLAALMAAGRPGGVGRPGVGRPGIRRPGGGGDGEGSARRAG